MVKSPTLIIAAGVVMILSGCVHGAIWLLMGGSWSGPLSIRKPILFGVSTGLTLVSLGWVQRKLKTATYDRVIGPLFASGMLIEVGLITLQYWRGEASHFNHSTPINSTIDRGLFVIVALGAGFIVDIFRRSLWDIDCETSMKWAIRGGLAFLVVSCGIGFFISLCGEYLSRQRLAPDTFGRSGVLKFPHGLTIHSVQLLPLLVWIMSLLGIRQSVRIRMVQYAIASTTFVLLFGCVQTFSGLARLDVQGPGFVLLLMAFVCAVPVLREFVRALPGPLGIDRRRSGSVGP